MTDDELNAAIAKARGWTPHGDETDSWKIPDSDGESCGLKGSEGWFGWPAFDIDPAQALALFAELPEGALFRYGDEYECTWHGVGYGGTVAPTPEQAIAHAWAQWKRVTE